MEGLQIDLSFSHRSLGNYRLVVNVTPVSKPGRGFWLLKNYFFFIEKMPDTIN
jgi:hypothetical protein